MALPLSIFDTSAFPLQAWQVEEAEDLVAAASQCLLDKRYEECRQKCNLALSCTHIWFETKLAAYIELAFSLDDWGGVRVRFVPLLFPFFWLQHS
jgi:hypothetical protein